MPTDVSYLTQKGQIGKETTEGTAVAALKVPAGIGFQISPDVTTDELKRMGYRWPTLITPGQVRSKVTFSGKPCYPDLPYIFSGVHRQVTPTTPGGGTDSRLWTYLQSSTDEDTVDSFTVEMGSRKLSRRAAGVIWTGYNFSWDTLKCDFSGEGFGRKMTTGLRLSTNEVQTITVDAAGGTFTVTFESQTTGNLAFNITASALQTALEGLSSIGAGNVSVTGGPGATNPLSVEFIGNLGQTNVNAMTTDPALLTGGAGTAVVATATPGVAPTELDAFDIQPNHIKVYSDTAYGSIGGTKLERLFSGSISIGSMRGPLHVVDRDQAGAPVGHLEGAEPVGEFRMKIMANEVADTHLADIYLGATRYFRVEAIGSVIEAALTYKAVWDFAAKIRSISEYGPEGNAFAQEFTWGIVHDTTFGRGVSTLVQNKQTAL